MSILGWIALGLVAGALARLLVPGRDPIGFIGTILLGIVGSLVGGFLADLLFDDEAVGLFGSVIGAVLVLLLYNTLVRSRNRGYARS
ncbi:MAG TPA: GlsB/YeaQ/YmgE family stress response membrane protein [Acidimicrobiia bacterium]|nr:GlsB/YeaQ/YmgE family stress response membrane protein [Acidimicrobiia bacterium]